MNALVVVGRLVALPGSAVQGVLSAPEQVRGVWSQITVASAQALHLLQRTRFLVDHIEATLAEVDAVVSQAAAVTESWRVVGQSAAGAAAEVRSTNDAAAAQAARVQQLLDLYEPRLSALAPLLEEAADSIKPAHLSTLRDVLEVTPNLLKELDSALRDLANLTPRIEQVTERVDHMGLIVEGLPGAKMLRRRGQARDEE